jgi:hypothetical protein
MANSIFETYDDALDYYRGYMIHTTTNRNNGGRLEHWDKLREWVDYKITTGEIQIKRSRN